jgi:hypothetical protein
MQAVDDSGETGIVALASRIWALSFWAMTPPGGLDYLLTSSLRVL